MKKNSYIIAAAFIIIIFSSVIVYRVVKQPGQIKEYNLAFAVLGDIHDDTKNLEGALKQLKKANSSIDALVLNGDMVDQGVDKQYADMKNFLKRKKRLLPDVVIKNMGNHEYYNYDENSKSSAEPKDFINKYFAFSGEKTVYHDRWIKGYHFISLGSEITNSSGLGSTAAFISEEQLAWLKSRLEEKYEKGKPIFVFLHQHLQLDTTGNQSRWQGIKQNNELRDILNKYPEVIMFNSHTHQSLYEQGIFIKQSFTLVQTGAVHGPYVADSSGKRGPSDGSQGTYVEVYNDKVVIQGRDFKNNTWIPSANNTVSLK